MVNCQTFAGDRCRQSVSPSFIFEALFRPPARSMSATDLLNPDLLSRYDISGPRYTSYPTAAQFTTAFSADDYLTAARDSNASGRPLSLYLHIPFCATVCYYCACNKIITANRQRATTYLEALHREIELQGSLFDRSRQVTQLHWGGGTPTFISDEQMTALMNHTRRHFCLADDEAGEFSIEIDPREVTPAKMALLRRLGFNRVSLGVQDFDPLVQRAVNRLQTETETWAAVTSARQLGFRSVNIDLIYGLPYQSVARFAVTMDKVLKMEPDRLSVFNYAHLPHMFKVQRQMDAATLPSATVKLDMLRFIIDRLTDAGYIYIGMDHFAKPDDELAKAQSAGELYRNFQGYSTQAGRDLVAMGLTSIGMVGDTYSQNHKDMPEYIAAIEAGHLPVFRGVALSAEDRLRRAIITQLICHFEVDLSELVSDHRSGLDPDFDESFAAERVRLKPMEQDGLVRLDGPRIQVQTAGRLLIRNICMVFDQYLTAEHTQRFSKVI